MTRPGPVVLAVGLLVTLLVTAVVIGDLTSRTSIILNTGSGGGVMPTATPETTRGSQPVPVLDPALLSILPASVSGIPVAAEPGSFADAVADPAFVANVASAAFATVVDGNDLASGVVANLRPGVYSDGFFRDWRDTYDAGACASSGGVAGNAQASLGGRIVYISNCSGALLVYHVWLPERGVLISLFSVGSRRFGEQVMAGLRP